MKMSLDASDAQSLEERVRALEDENRALRREVKCYRDAARMYGIDAYTMLELAKSQIRTCADNIRMMDKLQEIFHIFDGVSSRVTESDVYGALVCYDGDGSKPYCDLVYCGLDIIRQYLNRKEEYDAWRQGNLPEDF